MANTTSGWGIFWKNIASEIHICVNLAPSQCSTMFGGNAVYLPTSDFNILTCMCTLHRYVHETGYVQVELSICDPSEESNGNILIQSKCIKCAILSPKVKLSTDTW